MGGDIYLVSKDWLLSSCKRIADRQYDLDYVLLSINRIAPARRLADNLHGIKLASLIFKLAHHHLELALTILNLIS